MQFFLFICQRYPFDNREHDKPHVRGPDLLEETLTKKKKVPGSLTLIHLQATVIARSAVTSNRLLLYSVGGERPSDTEGGESSP